MSWLARRDHSAGFHRMRREECHTRDGLPSWAMHAALSWRHRCWLVGTSNEVVDISDDCCLTGYHVARAAGLSSPLTRSSPRSLLLRLVVTSNEVVDISG
jgi:hypothetical protein